MFCLLDCWSRRVLYRSTQKSISSVYCWLQKGFAFCSHYRVSAYEVLGCKAISIKNPTEPSWKHACLGSQSVWVSLCPALSVEIPRSIRHGWAPLFAHASQGLGTLLSLRVPGNTASLAGVEQSLKKRAKYPFISPLRLTGLSNLMERWVDLSVLHKYLPGLYLCNVQFELCN